MSYLVSTKGRYALRVLLDIAEQDGDSAVSLKGIAARQELSMKYLEAIMSSLKEAGLVTGMAGKGGGYKLTKPIDQYTVGEILRVTEDQLAPVACVSNSFVCPRANTCKTFPLWKNLDAMISEYLDTVKLSDLL